MGMLALGTIRLTSCESVAATRLHCVNCGPISASLKGAEGCYIVNVLNSVKRGAYQMGIGLFLSCGQCLYFSMLDLMWLEKDLG